MAGRIEMLERVRVLRILAASDVAARQAKPELVPGRADRHAIDAAVAARPYFTDVVEMLAAVGHFGHARSPGRCRAFRFLSGALPAAAMTRCHAAGNAVNAA